MSCLFCKIVGKEIPATVVAENDDALAFRDIHPAAPTHVLVIPKKHIGSVAEMGSDDAALLGRLVLFASEVAKKEGIGETGFRLVNNTGPNAGQSVFHLHWHVLGGRGMSWPPG